MPRNNRSQGVGQGPAKGPGNGSPKAPPLDTSPERQAKRSAKRWGGLKAKMAAYAAEHPESAVTERAPSRIELADLARSKMPSALAKLEILIHTSRSDVAVVQAFNALRETAYGKDPQSIDMRMNFEDMSEEELLDAARTELGIAALEADPEGSGTVGRIAAPETARQPE